MFWKPVETLQNPIVREKIKILDKHYKGLSSNVEKEIRKIANSKTLLKQNSVQIGDFTIKYELKYKLIVIWRQLVIEDIEVEGFDL